MFSISVPAFAQEAQNPGGRSISYSNNGVSIKADDGDILTFEVSDMNPNAPQIEYYYNGEFVCTYYLSQNGSGPVAVDRMGETHVVEDLSPTGSIALTPNGSRIGSVTTTLGRFSFYKPRGYSESLDPFITVTNRIVDAKEGSAFIRTPAEESFSDALMTLLDGLFDMGFEKADLPTEHVLQRIAAPILEDMITDVGGKIINGIISVALNQRYTVVNMTEELQALPVPIGNKATYTYTETYAVYGENDYRANGFVGDFTRYNWSTEAFAKTAWNDTFGEEGYDDYPGIKDVELY